MLLLEFFVLSKQLCDVLALAVLCHDVELVIEGEVSVHEQ